MFKLDSTQLGSDYQISQIANKRGVGRKENKKCWKNSVICQRTDDTFHFPEIIFEGAT